MPLVSVPFHPPLQNNRVPETSSTCWLRHSRHDPRQNECNHCCRSVSFRTVSGTVSSLHDSMNRVWTSCVRWQHHGAICSWYVMLWAVLLSQWPLCWTDFSTEDRKKTSSCSFGQCVASVQTKTSTPLHSSKTVTLIALLFPQAWYALHKM